MGEQQRYFLMVDWCSKGRRGVFCDSRGHAFAKDDAPHTWEEQFDILDVFYMVLAPESLLLTESQLREYTQWIPLEEYSSQYGVAHKAADLVPDAPSRL